jgi:hypothetical protein
MQQKPFSESGISTQRYESWLFVAQRSESSSRTEVKAKLEEMFVPTHSVAISALSALTGRYAVALIPEQLLSKHHKDIKDKEDLKHQQELRQIEQDLLKSVADYLIVVCESDSTSPEDIAHLYGIEVAKCMHSKISTNDLFHFVIVSVAFICSFVFSCTLLSSADV